MLNNSTILVTGGTGSFGHKFIERVLEQYEPKKIIIYSNNQIILKYFLFTNEKKSCIVFA